MSKILKISILFLLCHHFSNSQSIVAYSISPLSATSTTNYQVNYTIGLNVQQSDNTILFNSNIFSFFTSIKPKKNNNNDVLNNIIFDCYPNPTTNFANIIITSKNIFSSIDIFVYNSNAQKQQCFWNLSKVENYYKIYIDFQSLNPDLYIVEIIFDQKIKKNLKIIKK